MIAGGETSETIERPTESGADCPVQFEMTGGGRESMAVRNFNGTKTLHRSPRATLRVHQVTKLADLRDRIREVFKLENFDAQITHMSMWAIEKGKSGNLDYSFQLHRGVTEESWPRLAARLCNGEIECQTLSFWTRRLEEGERLWECRPSAEETENLQNAGTEEEAGRSANRDEVSRAGNDAVEAANNDGTAAHDSNAAEGTDDIDAGATESSKKIWRRENTRIIKRTTKKGETWKIVKTRRKEKTWNQAAKCQVVRTWKKVETFKNDEAAEEDEGTEGGTQEGKEEEGAELPADFSSDAS